MESIHREGKDMDDGDDRTGKRTLVEGNRGYGEERRVDSERSHRGRVDKARQFLR